MKGYTMSTRPEHISALMIKIVDSKPAQLMSVLAYTCDADTTRIRLQNFLAELEAEMEAPERLRPEELAYIWEHLHEGWHHLRRDFDSKASRLLLIILLHLKTLSEPAAKDPISI